MVRRRARTPLNVFLNARLVGQLRQNRFKLALAVGDNRHYVIGGISPRHFAQTVAREGLPALTINEICRELAEGAEPAIETVLESLPQQFPTELADSVINGIRARLRLMEQTLA